MKKIALIAFLITFTAISASADDIITKLNGEQIAAIVTEVGTQTVLYKRADNPEGPVYVLSTAEISSIRYENGYVEIYNDTGYKDEQPSTSVYDIRYRDISGSYNPHAYRAQYDDPYIPALSGIASFFIPGLGQCIDGEWGRGLGIAAANVGFGLLELTEASLLFYSAADGSSYYKKYGITSTKSNTIMAVSLCSALLTTAAHFAFNVWNIFDAVNVAKVKNMYYQDIHFEPQVALVPSLGNGFQPSAGIGLRVTF
ncbi:MAG: hypothetical protein J5737_06045 [Bacteroidales bacterium]|nr:hypothetical protein [Bacteroidales bacterium]